MMIKLICIDMDGTLLKTENEIGLEDQLAIKQAVEQGVLVSITTGRVFNCAQLYANEIGLKTLIIASNGAYIGDVNGQDIYCNPLDIQDIRYFLELTSQQGLLSYLTAKFGVISTVELPETNIYKRLNQTLKSDEQIRLEVLEGVEEIIAHYPTDILKGVCIGEDASQLDKVKQQIKQKCPHLEVVSSWKNNFEVMRKGSSKGEAVAQLAKFYQISPDEVMCIGDSENDLSMIEFAGIGVAMGNAMDQVKEVADFVTKTNQEAGVAHAIDLYVLNE